MTDSFDLIIIGAGSGNSIPSPEFADWRIAIIDDGDHFGGTCLNNGCIPTKMYAHPANLVHAAREAARLGVTASASADWRAVRERVLGRIDAISEGGEAYRAHGETNISLVRETVRFVGTNELETASGRRLRADHIVIGAGSRPRRPDVLPTSERIITNEEAVRLEQLPDRIVVIGGGAIGCEFAAIFHGFGAKVTQLVRGRVLPALDEDIAAAFEASATWELREHVEVVGAVDTGEAVRLELSDGSTTECDLVLNATGRIPNTDRLATGAAGFDLHADHRLVVDEYLRVLRNGEPAPGVWAIGDICSADQLKHVANEHARVVAANLLAQAAGEPLRANSLRPVPMVVFSAPEVACFGHSLAQARGEGLDAVRVRQDYAGTARGWALDDTASFCQLVVERGSGALLGAQIIGPDAAVLLQPLVQAAAFDQSVRGLARGQYWPHPAASEIIENALLAAEAALDTDTDAR